MEFNSGFKGLTRFKTFTPRQIYATIFRFNATWHKRYALIRGLKRFGINDTWPHSSCVGD